MDLLLDRESRDVLTFLRKVVAKYALKHSIPQAARFHPPVTAVSIRFEPGEAAGLDLCFDTRARFKWDGNWSHDSFGSLPRPSWQRAYTSLEAGSVCLVSPDGSTTTLPADTSDEAWTCHIGAFLVAAVAQAHSEGVFTSLPQASGCMYLVEDLEGFFRESASPTPTPRKGAA